MAERSTAAQKEARLIDISGSRRHSTLLSGPSFVHPASSTLHWQAMGCCNCRHRPAGCETSPGPSPQRACYDSEGFAIDRVTRRRLLRTYSEEFQAPAGASEN